MSQGHRFHPTLLREYDLRGVVGKTLVEADAVALGRALAVHVGQQPEARALKRPLRFCVGRDGRLSSPSLHKALVDSIAASGVDVIDIGLGPTPMLYFAVHAMNADAGAMVTGSHNAPEYNGFKLCAAKARPIYGEAIRTLGAIAAEGAATSGKGHVDGFDLRGRYVARLREGLPAALEQPLKVGWDPGNGAAGEVLARLVATLPGEHIVLNGTIDGRFPAHHPDPTIPENLSQLIETVRAKRLDLGIAFDGDGDRIGVVDERGRIVWGDQLVALLARDVIARHGAARPIILDIKSSAACTEHIERSLKGTPMLWRTGHSLIKAKMAETGAPLAGEMSGHIFFADGYYGFDDALYAAVRLLALLGAAKRSLASLVDELPRYVSTPELRIDCPDERKFDVMRHVEAKLRADGASLLDIDGVRVSTVDGWWLLRASNTQPALVARAEARTADGLDRLKSALSRALGDAGLSAPRF
ncbi:MAG: phosphomannomutase/phosphoglucomutase [Alphaproteobacteria bacterium]|nr:phosphomannomutase/phosphoglucomutase [Alphaproteobacteria bacterium]